MKSIQSKIVLLVLLSIIVSAVTIGGIAIISIERSSSNDATEVMNLACSAKVHEMNTLFGKIEQSVQMLAIDAVDNLESIERLSEDEEYLKEYTKYVDKTGKMVASQTDGAIAVYTRFVPELTSSKAGFFRVKNSRTGEFETVEVTDIGAYDKEDIERVGWYYLPIESGEAIWMQPYMNKNIEIYMISYVIPIYKDNRLFGVVGMDIDFSYITAKCDNIRLYETGGAFLTDEDFRIVHSKNFERGTWIKNLSESLAKAQEETITSTYTLYDYEVEGVKKKVAFQRLQNGMCLAVSAPVDEIDGEKDKLLRQMILIAIGIEIVFILIALWIARTIIKPLRKLNKAAQEIACGNLDVSLDYKSKDEVGTLSASLKETTNQLKKRIEYINNLAYMDKLTDKKNNTAYMRDVTQLKEKMEAGKCDFSICIIDVNGLKYVNDTYGHGYGNELLIAAANLITENFGDNVYRIGGDEFVVLYCDDIEAGKIETTTVNVSETRKEKTGKIRQNTSNTKQMTTNAKTTKTSSIENVKQKLEKQVQEFDRVLQAQQNNNDIIVSVAVGYAVYDETKDTSYESVFKRADERMYQKKMQMKEQGESSRVKVEG